MQRYKVEFEHDGKIETAFVVATDRAEAISAFSVKNPNVDSVDIVSVEEVIAESSNSTSESRSGKLPESWKPTPPEVSGYATSRRLSSFISGFGWLIVVVGGLISLVGLGEANAFVLTSSVGFTINGLFLVMAGQIIRALIATADQTRAIYELLVSQTDKHQ